MATSLIVFLLMSCSLWNLGDCSTYIIGGVPAVRGEFPFVALILRDGEFICGGTLLSPRTVLTAWHCTWPYEASYSVRLGEHDRSKVEGEEQTIAVSQILPHPRYDVDMAILVLDKPVVINRWVKTAELVKDDPMEGYRVTAVGWGWTKSGTRSMSDILQKLVVPIQSAQVCYDDGITWIDDKTQICAGLTIYDKYVNVCHRDSGSPLLITDLRDGRTKVAGAVQGGHSGCSSDKHMATFTRIAPFREWILKNVKTVSSNSV